MYVFRYSSHSIRTIDPAREYEELHFATLISRRYKLKFLQKKDLELIKDYEKIKRLPQSMWSQYPFSLDSFPMIFLDFLKANNVDDIDKSIKTLIINDEWIKMEAEENDQVNSLPGELKFVFRPSDAKDYKSGLLAFIAFTQDNLNYDDLITIGKALNASDLAVLQAFAMFGHQSYFEQYLKGYIEKMGDFHIQTDIQTKLDIQSTIRRSWHPKDIPTFEQEDISDMIDPHSKALDSQLSKCFQLAVKHNHIDTVKYMMDLKYPIFSVTPETFPSTKNYSVDFQPFSVTLKHFIMDAKEFKEMASVPLVDEMNPELSMTRSILAEAISMAAALGHLSPIEMLVLRFGEEILLDKIDSPYQSAVSKSQIHVIKYLELTFPHLIKNMLSSEDYEVYSNAESCSMMQHIEKKCDELGCLDEMINAQGRKRLTSAAHSKDSEVIQHLLMFPLLMDYANNFEKSPDALELDKPILDELKGFLKEQIAIAKKTTPYEQSNARCSFFGKQEETSPAMPRRRQKRKCHP